MFRALTLEHVVREQMLALALMEYFAAFLVVILGDEHPVQEIGIIVLLCASSNRGRVILNDFLIFILHQFLPTLQDDCGATREEVAMHAV